tara:strand:- start:223 stop:501 length:279 start_codon:yes stop_codon:yes gene_type:complete
MATASIRDPIIKKTASLIKEDATWFGVAMPNSTWNTRMSIATAGSGIGSKMIKRMVERTMMMVWYPSAVKPSGVGNRYKTVAREREISSHLR